MNEFEYSLSLYEKALPDDMSLEEKISTSLRFGFDSCEICIDLDPIRRERLNWSEKRILKLVNFLDRNNIDIPTFSLSALRGCPLGTLDKDVNGQALEMITAACSFGKKVGSQIMLVNTYDVYNSLSTHDTCKRFEENIYRATEIAERYGIILALENAEMAFGDSAEKVSYWIDKIDSPNLKMYYDPANAYNAFLGYFQKVKNDFRFAQGKVVAAHLKDSVIGEYRMTPYGEGQVDFKKVIQMMLEEGIGQFTAELFKRPDKSWDEYSQWVNMYLRKFFKQIEKVGR